MSGEEEYLNEYRKATQTRASLMINRLIAILTLAGNGYDNDRIAMKFSFRTPLVLWNFLIISDP